MDLLETIFLAIPWLGVAGFLAITFAVWRRHRRWVDAPKTRVMAEIARVDEQRDPDDGSVSYTAVYRFRTAAGQWIEAPELGSGIGRPTVGATLPVWYDQGDPTQVSGREGGMTTLAWVVLGLFNLGAVALAWWANSLVDF